MKIFLIGKSVANSAFCEYFSCDKENMVFSNFDNQNAEFVDIETKNALSLVEFAKENEINLTVLCSNEAIFSDIAKEFIEAGLSVFAPEGSALKAVESKSFAKRFIYRNKILTPRFQIYEKAQPAIDAIRQMGLPVVIKPDEHSEISTRICETYGAARNAIEEFFNTGSKKVVMEEYLSGKEFSVYAVCDGYNPVVAGDCAVYQSSVAKLEADFLDENLKSHIMNDVITPFVSALARELGEYIGILGFDFILSNGKIYLLECNPFFKDIDAKMFVFGVKADWAKIFEGAISGTLLEENGEINLNDLHSFASQFYENGKKVNVVAFARTINAAKEHLLEEITNKEEFNEALNVWKS